jgi:hypothetical protein
VTTYYDIDLRFRCLELALRLRPHGSSADLLEIAAKLESFIRAPRPSPVVPPSDE